MKEIRSKETERLITPQHIPKESIGLCTNCNTQDLLGDGLCGLCWDSQFDGLRKSKIKYVLENSKSRVSLAKELNTSPQSISRYKALIKTLVQKV